VCPADGANTAYPGNDAAQNTHRDCPGNQPRHDACPGLVVNVPLQDFTVLNGATRVFLGTHLLRGLPADVAALGTEARVVASKGDLILRDLRLAHGGMPNRSSEIRTMLAMVHTAAQYRGGDETAFKGFEAEQGEKLTEKPAFSFFSSFRLFCQDRPQTAIENRKRCRACLGSESFWRHRRLHTSVAFEPAPMAHRTPGHSSPRTALGDEYKARKRSEAEALLHDAAVGAWLEQLRTDAAEAIDLFEASDENFRSKVMALMTARVGGMPELLQEARSRVDNDATRDAGERLIARI
jgi:hypothetical protein